MSDYRIKVTVEDGTSVRVFVASGETVRYDRDTFVECRPTAVPGARWPKKTTTVHRLTWESTTYE